MSGTDTQPDDNDGEEFDLAEFIDDKSSLFAVMGVFVPSPRTSRAHNPDR